MARTLFFHVVLVKLMETTNNKPIFSQYNIFDKYKYRFFNLCSDLFSIIAKNINQIRNNVVCVAVRLIFIFRCALTVGCCNAFQHILVNQKKLKFYNPYFRTMLFIVTIVRKKALNPRRKIECTCARMMGKSPDVQFGIWFSTWNLRPVSGKWGEISEALKRCCVDICCLQEVRWTRGYNDWKWFLISLDWGL